ncbi:MAG: nickel-dependent lactate racemase [Candidatus Brockarchaeota archaeon]|nr:nickel-dependent lactate racemase [Candidatus Brockarchaeota archaeon]
MEVKLRYGADEIEVELPDGRVAFVAGPEEARGAGDLESRVAEALANPVGSPPLRRVAGKGKKVAIAVDDLTRSTPCRAILPKVLGELAEAGVREKDVKVIIALGTHRPMTDAEIVERYGEEVVSRVEVENHDAKSKGAVTLGKTPSGTPVIVNREFQSAEVKVAIGNVIPHLYAGWSGGAKSVQPGVSSEATTFSTHIAAARVPFEEILGKAENPIRRDMEDVARRVGLDFIVNTVLNGRGELVEAFAGDMVRAHREAVGLASGIFCPRIPSEADVVLVSSHPADIDYWQAVKGAVSASMAVKRGGTVILVTPCREGISPTHPDAERHGRHDLQEVERLVEDRAIQDLASAAFAMVQARVRRKAKLVIVSEGLSRRQCASLGAEKAGSVREALEVSEAVSGRQASIGVLTTSEVVPVIER